MADRDQVGVAHGPVQSELLCFIADKTKSMPLDDIVKICEDFYREDEVVAARNLLNSFLPVGSKRLGKRQGADRVRTTLEDTVKMLLNPSVALPVFYAVNMSRLPPVDASHCDVAAILRELSMLRQEVRAVAQLRKEVAELRRLIATKPAPELSSNRGQQETESELATGTTLTRRWSSVAAQLPRSESAATGAGRKKLPVRKPVVGASELNKHVKSVSTSRCVDIFVSRLHPLTTAEELVDSVHSVKDHIAVHEVNCTKLKSRYEELYSSYHIAIRVSADQLTPALDIFMAAEAWASGVFVRRYFKPKDGRAQ